jgi:hypothetical protein
MDSKDVVAAVEKSQAYVDFMKDKAYYLVHVFIMHPSPIWQVGYYSKESDKVIVFDYENDIVTITPEQEAFKEKNFISPLKISEVMVSKEAAMSKVSEVVKTHYGNEDYGKAIVLLQNLPEYGQLWNVTAITNTFNVINVKINASTGDIIKHSKETLMGWKKE